MHFHANERWQGRACRLVPCSRRVKGPHKDLAQTSSPSLQAELRSQRESYIILHCLWLGPFLLLRWHDRTSVKLK